MKIKLINEVTRQNIIALVLIFIFYYLGDCPKIYFRPDLNRKFY